MSVLKIALVLALLLTPVLVCSQNIPATDAGKHVGEHATVCGVIASEHTATSSRGAPTFINLDKPYPNQVFTILIWNNERERVGDLPRSGRLCATGSIANYRGTPEIVLHDKEAWFVPK